MSWNKSFCSCVCDPAVCIKLSCCFPCHHGCNAGMLHTRDLNAEMDMTQCCLMYCCPQFASCLLCIQRGKIRQEFGIQGNGCVDFVLSCCFPCCVAGQITVEMKSRWRPQKATVVAPVGYGSPEDMSMSRWAAVGSLDRGVNTPASWSLQIHMFEDKKYMNIFKNKKKLIEL